MTAAGTLLYRLPSSAWQRRRVTLSPSPRLAHGGCCTACFLGSHGSGSPPGQPAWLCPPDRGQGMPRSPLARQPGSLQRWAGLGSLAQPCVPLPGAGRAQPTLCGHKGASALAAAEGQAEAGQGGCPGACCIWGGGARRQEGCWAAAQSPRLSRDPLLLCLGTAQRCCAKGRSSGAAVGDIRVLHKKETLSGTVQAELASAPAPGA